MWIMRNKLQSLLVLAALAVSFTVFAYILWNWMWTAPTPLRGFLWPSCIMGFAFGMLAWSTITIPDKAPSNTGWKLYRFPLWVFGIFTISSTEFVTNGDKLTFGLVFSTALLSLMIAGVGWALGSKRADYAAYLYAQKHPSVEQIQKKVVAVHDVVSPQMISLAPDARDIQTIMKNNLKPCPFCGGMGVPINSYRDDTKVFRSLITCGKCGASVGGNFRSQDEARDEAVKRWECRTI